MKTHRVLFLGTPIFAVQSLKSLFEDRHFDIALVVTQPDRPSGRGKKILPSEVSQYADSVGLPLFKPESINTPESLNHLQSLECESAVVVAYGQILSQKFLDLFPKGAVNVHGSLLPRWRGAAPIQRCLMNGDTETGVSLQRVVRKLDAGPVLGARKISLRGDEKADEVYQQLSQLGGELLQKEYIEYLSGHLQPKDQEESQVTIAPKIEKEEGLIIWNKTAEEIFNQYRGLSEWPGVWTFRNEKRIRLQGLSPSDSKLQKRPGSIIEIGGGKIRVAAGAGSILLGSVQPESKPFMGAEDYSRGYGLKIGEVLG